MIRGETGEADMCEKKGDVKHYSQLSLCSIFGTQIHFVNHECVGTVLNFHLMIVSLRKHYFDVDHAAKDRILLNDLVNTIFSIHSRNQFVFAMIITKIS